MAKKPVSKVDSTKRLIELAEECILDTGTPDSSAALVWGPKVGYMFRSPRYEDGKEVSALRPITPDSYAQDGTPLLKRLQIG